MLDRVPVGMRAVRTSTGSDALVSAAFGTGTLGITFLLLGLRCWKSLSWSPMVQIARNTRAAEAFVPRVWPWPPLSCVLPAAL